MKKLIEITCLLKKLVNDDLVNIIISYYFRKVSHKKCLKCQKCLFELSDKDYDETRYPFCMRNNYIRVNEIFNSFEKELDLENYDQYICIYCNLVYIKCSDCDNFLQNIKCYLFCVINDIDKVMKTNPTLLDKNDNELGTLKEMLDNKKIELIDDHHNNKYFDPTNKTNEYDYSFPGIYWDLTKYNLYFYSPQFMFDIVYNHFEDERFDTYWKCNNCNKLFIMQGN